MDNTLDFEDIRPYDGKEISQVMQKLLQDEKFAGMLTNNFPVISMDEIRKLAPHLTSSVDMQKAIVAPMLEYLVKNLTTGLSVSGEENIGRAPSVFMSNHRDIVIDPSFLCLSLVRTIGDTCEIAIGDNLLANDMIKALVKLNRCFIVKRGLPARELAKAFMQLSSYIRYAVTDKKVSVWIAQREGRAKDSNDRTQESLIKMMALSGREDFISNLKALNICPVAISYECDPCDYLKAIEFQHKRDDASYKKTKEEDVMSMQTGIMGWKGHVHYAFTHSINDKLDEIASSIQNKKEQAAAICALCDRQIHAAYMIYPINRWAYEQLTGDAQYASADSAADRTAAEKYLKGQLAKITIENKDDEFLWKKLLEMYANPFINYLAATK